MDFDFLILADDLGLAFGVDGEAFNLLKSMDGIEGVRPRRFDIGFLTDLESLSTSLSGANRDRLGDGGGRLWK